MDDPRPVPWFERVFGSDGEQVAKSREPFAPTGAQIAGIVAALFVVAIIAIVLIAPRPSSDENAALQLTIQEYCNGDAKWGEAIEARNQLIENYRAGTATQDDLSIAVDNFSCMSDSAEPLESELGQ